MPIDQKQKMNTARRLKNNANHTYLRLPFKVFFTCLLFLLASPLLCHGQNDLQKETTTINSTDNAGLKQGLWRSKSKNNVVEEGNYINGKKDGVWTATYPTGKKKHAITFANGLPKGPATFYYENGQIMEQGIWEVNHWKGSYTFYHTNGKPAYQFNFNDAGKREGVQHYFHENGNLKYAGTWEDGKPDGAVEVFNEQGAKVSERLYNEGEFSKSIKNTKSQEDTQATFTGTGEFTLYNLNGNIDKKGYFKAGKLINGELHIYNQQNELIRVETYTNGIRVK